MALLLEYEFKALPADKQIDTEPFLEAVAHLPPFFDCLGTPIVYAPVKADLSGNIKKIRAVYESNPTKFKTLQNILEAEKEMHGAAWPKVGATLALMWLKRGLKFIQVLLQSLCDGERDEENPNLIRVNATKAYELALRKYHGWMLQKLFLGSVYALPYKSDLLKALEKGKEVKEEETLEKIHQFLSKATPILDAIYEMYTKMNAELSYKA
ncbi:glycolipid transfer protein [Podarcis muralis]|uniref:Glycolipid transfer protein n=1 Tax=Podarcis muralis TaxID=64176 RepID=A0A670J4B2_PODMU|nr:glycolipid transfer protein [Podarcis muralis]XP_053218304.1 glycolipid transfer protein [Podarcis raffonei]